MLLDGTRIDGPLQLDAWLTSHPDVFVGTLTEQLLTYALGRGLTANDMPVVRGIVNHAARDHYRLQDILFGIIESRPFQMRRKVGAAAPPQQTAQVRE